MKYKNKYTLTTWLVTMLKNLLRDERDPEQRKKIKFEIGKLDAIKTNK
jgi:hypothetical protein